MVRLDLGERTATRPIILQRISIHHLLPLDALDQGHIHGIQIHAIIPVVHQMLKQFHTHPRRSGNDVRIMVTREEGIGESDSALSTDGRLQSSTYRSTGQAEERGGVPAIVGSGHDEVYWSTILEEVEQSKLRGSGRGAINKHPVLIRTVAAGCRLQRLGMRGAVVLMQTSGAEVGRFDDLSGEVGFPNPRALLVRKDDGDGVVRSLQGLDKRVDIRRRLHEEFKLGPYLRGCTYGLPGCLEARRRS